MASRSMSHQPTDQQPLGWPDVVWLVPLVIVAAIALIYRFF